MDISTDLEFKVMDESYLVGVFPINKQITHHNKSSLFCGLWAICLWCCGVNKKEDEKNMMIMLHHIQQ